MDVSFKLGIIAALNPRAASVISGTSLGFFEKVSGEQTGLPNVTDAYESLSSEFTKFTYDFVKEMSNSIENDSSNNFKNNSESYWSNNPYD